MSKAIRVLFAVAWLLDVSGCASQRPIGELDEFDFLTAFEERMVYELNLARTQPKKYASFIRQWKQHYDGIRRKLPGRIPVVTSEGVKALDEAVQYLNGVRPVGRLRPARGMSLGARDHLKDMGPSGALGHTGYDSSKVGQRVNRYGKWHRSVGENISYGGDIAREIVMRFIIDDGVPDRGHRRNVFNGDFRVVGVSFGYHKQYQTMCVTTLAWDYTE